MKTSTMRSLGAGALLLCALACASDALAQGGTWAPVTPMTYARGGPTVGAINGRLYVTGGRSYELPSEVYDPATEAWTTLGAPLSPARGGYGAAIGGKLYVVGGCLGNDCRIGVTNMLQAYDPATNLWTTKTPMPTARFGPGVGVIDGKLYVAGGEGPCPPCTAYFTALEVYDPATDTWATKAPMPTARGQMSAGVVDGKLYVVGGVNASAWLATLEVYDPATDMWTTKAPLPTPRFGLSVGAVDGKLYVLGGQDSTGLTRAVEVYDPVANTWTAGTEAPMSWGSPGVELLEGTLFVVGSCSASESNACTTVETFVPAQTTVVPQAPTACISPAHPCVPVPVTITRAGGDDVRGVSIKVQLAGDLELCGAGIVEGGYLSGVGTTYFDVTDNGGGSYTVDCAILGLPCGAVAASGTLFTVNVGSAVSSGTGTVTLVDVALRDCSNGDMSATAGPAASIAIDEVAPTAIGGLTAAQLRSGNDSDGTTKVTVSWPAVESGGIVHVYRAGYGGYPEYDDGGGAMPGAPVAYPPALPWTLAGDVSSGTTLVDEMAWPGRDYWYYVAYVEDACGNVSAVSNETGGTLNYHLGDVHDGTTDCSGDNKVLTADVSLLGMYYGLTGVSGVAYPACLDVGPTTTRYVDGRPSTDDRVNFEDLMMFAINYGTASASLTTLPVAAVAEDVVWVEGPEKVTVGEPFTVTLRMKGTGVVLGLSAQLGWDHAIAEMVGVEAGELVLSGGGLVLNPGSGKVDCSVLGADQALAGDGEVARARFRALASGAPKVVLTSLDARDAANRTLTLVGAMPAPMPAATALAPAMPNPFQRTTTLSYALAREGAVELAVYGIDGRKVTTLASGVRAVGTYRLTWDGRDGNGQPVRPGMYYARLLTPDGRFTRTLVLMK